MAKPRETSPSYHFDYCYTSYAKLSHLSHNKPLVIVKRFQLIEPFGEVAIRQDVIH